MPDFEKDCREAAKELFRRGKSISEMASIIARHTKAPELAEALENVLNDYDERERIYPGSESNGHPAKVKVMESARALLASLEEKTATPERA